MAAVAPAMASEVQKDLIISWGEMVTGQASDLWNVALALLIAQVLVLATIHGSKDKSPLVLTCLLWVSAALSFVSMFFGYAVKGAVIQGIGEIIKKSELVLPSSPGFDAILQFFLLVCSLVLFVVLFGFYRTTISKALLGIVRGTDGSS